MPLPHYSLCGCPENPFPVDVGSMCDPFDHLGMTLKQVSDTCEGDHAQTRHLLGCAFRLRLSQDVDAFPGLLQRKEWPDSCQQLLGYTEGSSWAYRPWGLCSIKVQHRQAPAHRVSNSLIPMCMNSSTLLFTLRGKPLNPLRHRSLRQPVRGCCFLCPLIQLAKSSCGSGGRLAQSVVSCST